MKIVDLFSGIGGFSLAAHWAGLSTALFCENNQFAQHLLRRNFPGTPIYDDVFLLKNQDIEKHVSPKESILTGGFPCQPFSSQGKRKGASDERAIFPEAFRIINEFRPKWCILENVYGLLSIHNGSYIEQEITTPLEDIGYTLLPLIIPASGVGAWHQRYRIWLVCAYTGYWNFEGNAEQKKFDNANEKKITNDIERSIECNSFGSVSNANSAGLQRRELSHLFQKSTPGSIQDSWRTNWIECAARLCRVADGLPLRMDGFKLSTSKHREERIKVLGNTIVPLIPYYIYKTIIHVENNYPKDTAL